MLSTFFILCFICCFCFVLLPIFSSVFLVCHHPDATFGWLYSMPPHSVVTKPPVVESSSREASHPISRTDMPPKVMRPLIKEECSLFSSSSDDEREDRIRKYARLEEQQHLNENANREKLKAHIEQLVDELSELVSCFYYEERMIRRRHYNWKVMSIPKTIDAVYLHRLLQRIEMDKDLHTTLHRCFAYIEGRRRDLKDYINILLAELDSSTQS